MSGEVTVVANRSVAIAGQFVGGTDETPVAADYQAIYRQDIADASIDYRVDFPITYLNVRASVLESTQDVEVYTNAIHSGAYDQHISLKARTPVVFTLNDPTPTFSHDVVTFYITNSSGFPANVTIAVACKQAPTGTV